MDKEEKNELSAKDLKELLEKAEQEKKAYLEGWQRERADFINYKKDEADRIRDMADYALEAMALKIISVIDNFEIAEKHLSEEQKKDKSAQGILMIKKQLLDILKAQGIEQMDFLGKKFDPNYCDAQEEIEDKTRESGKVAEEILKAYARKDKVIRPAKVKIIK